MQHINFDVMTLFPEMFVSFKETSIIKKAIDKQLISVNTYNIRDYSKKKSKSVDDYVYGGAQGMLMECSPIVDCFRDITKQYKKVKTIYLSPRGEIFSNNKAKELVMEENIILLCGHYEGIDERALQLIEAEEISIGDYILTGGELPCMILIDAISRFVDGVLHSTHSAYDDSFSDFLLEEEQYTRPSEFEGLKVPEVLLSGDHKKIATWRLERKKQITKSRRPDLYKKYIENNKGG